MEIEKRKSRATATDLAPFARPDSDRIQVAAAANPAALSRAASLAIARIDALEHDLPEPFSPGVWWGSCLKRRRYRPAMLAALLALSTRLELGQRPENPWAYLETLYREKRADAGAAAAERTAIADRLAPVPEHVRDIFARLGGKW